MRARIALGVFVIAMAPLFVYAATTAPAPSCSKVVDSSKDKSADKSTTDTPTGDPTKQQLARKINQALGLSNKCSDDKVWTKGEGQDMQLCRQTTTERPCKTEEEQTVCGTVTIQFPSFINKGATLKRSKCDKKATVLEDASGQYKTYFSGDTSTYNLNLPGNTPPSLKEFFSDQEAVRNALADPNKRASLEQTLECFSNAKCDSTELQKIASPLLGEKIASNLAGEVAQMKPEERAAAGESAQTALEQVTNPNGTFSTEEFSAREKTERPTNPPADFSVPQDKRYLLPASLENAARVACEYRSSFGENCDPQKAAAVGNAVIQMETGGNNPRCTGQYCGWFQMGADETRWALQEIRAWRDSPNISPEARDYADSLLQRAQQIGANYGALNADPMLGPALGMARLSNTRLSDSDGGVPALTNIQGMTDDLRTQAKLAFLNQFMPAGWKGGQFNNWDAPLSGSMASAIGNQYQRIGGAYTVGQALSVMDGMGKYMNPIDRGFQSFNGLLSARGDGALVYGAAPPPGTFIGGLPQGSTIVTDTYGSPFASIYQPAYATQIARPATIGTPTATSYQTSYPVQNGVPITTAQPVTQTQSTTTVIVPIPPVATLIARPVSVSRGGVVTLIWSSVGMLQGVPCLLFEALPETVKLAEGNGGAYQFATSKTSSTTSYVFSLSCHSATDASLIVQNASTTVQ